MFNKQKNSTAGSLKYVNMKILRLNEAIFYVSTSNTFPLRFL